MMGAWRPLAVAAALSVVIGVGVADAQTVIVRNAPPGSAIELAFNATTIGSATANAVGEATLAFKNAEDTKRDVRIVVDACGKVRRVLLVERYGQPPAPGEGCDRKEIPGFFVMQRVTTFVLDVAGASPMVWLRQGPAPTEWLTQAKEEAGGAAPARIRRPSPTGLVMSGGAGVTTFGAVTAQACGNVPDCSGRTNDFSYTVTLGFWLTRFLAAEGSFVRPASFNVVGNGTGYRFNTNFDPRLYTIVAKAGVPLGPIRPYGLAGMNYHQATSSTANTIEDQTVTVDNVPQTIPGGVQTYDLKTQGWGWLVGGGVEAWVSRRAAIYGEIARAQIKGSPTGGGTGAINDRVTLVLIGARVHIWP